MNRRRAIHFKYNQVEETEDFTKTKDVLDLKGLVEEMGYDFWSTMNS